MIMAEDNDQNSQATIKPYEAVRKELTSKLENGELIVLEGSMQCDIYGATGMTEVTKWWNGFPMEYGETTWKTNVSSYVILCDDDRVYELHVKKKFSKIKSLDQLRAYVSKEGFDENKRDHNIEFLEKIIDGEVIALISGDQEYKF